MSNLENIESICEKVLDHSGSYSDLPERSKTETAFDFIARMIVEQLDSEDDINDFIFNYGDEDAEENDYNKEDLLNYAKMAITGTIESLNPFSQGELKLYRTIRISNHDDIITGPSAAEIGINWTDIENINEPDFLDQYGSKSENSYDIKFSAVFDKTDVNWLATILCQNHPRIEDYSEFVLLPTAKPKSLAVTHMSSTKESPSL